MKNVTARCPECNSGLYNVMNKVWLVLLNWRNAQDTVECLQSVLSDQSDKIFGVVVCDNASDDGSISIIKAWANEIGWREREFTWSVNEFISADNGSQSEQSFNRHELVLIHTGSNLGFAGGNNVGIKFIQRYRDYDFIFLLNNDALLTDGAVEAMVQTFEDDQTVGMCGATVVYHHTPDRVQAFGGSRFSPLFGRASHIGAGRSIDAPRDREKVELELGYILGAALMISRSCLEVIGLMEERYFLYYEEIDWATRAKRAGFRLAYTPEAVIFHKEGGTIGSSADKNKRSLLSEYYLVRSRLMFTRKLYPLCLPTVVLFTGFQVFRHLVRFHYKRFTNGCRALFGLPFQRT